jgi:hypothetical protein
MVHWPHQKHIAFPLACCDSIGTYKCGNAIFLRLSMDEIVHLCKTFFCSETFVITKQINNNNNNIHLLYCTSQLQIEELNLHRMNFIWLCKVVPRLSQLFCFTIQYYMSLLTGSNTSILHSRWTASCVAWLDKLYRVASAG